MLHSYSYEYNSTHTSTHVLYAIFWASIFNWYSISTLACFPNRGAVTPARFYRPCCKTSLMEVGDETWQYPLGDETGLSDVISLTTAGTAGSWHNTQFALKRLDLWNWHSTQIVMSCWSCLSFARGSCISNMEESSSKPRWGGSKGSPISPWLSGGPGVQRPPVAWWGPWHTQAMLGPQAPVNGEVDSLLPNCPLYWIGYILLWRFHFALVSLQMVLFWEWPLVCHHILCFRGKAVDCRTSTVCW